MRRQVLLLTVACSLAAGGAAVALATAEPAHTTSGMTTTTAGTDATTTITSSAVIAFTGHGWGHGLGMSQWGADGYARHGLTYDRILAHYYTGTTLGAAKIVTVRVLLENRKKVTLSSTARWTVSDSTGASVVLKGPALTLGPKLAIAGEGSLQPPLTFRSTQPLVVDGRPFRGTVVLQTNGKRVEVVDTVGLEAYLKGVVPAEMPSRWPAQALEAQAVAARSYALANLAKNRDFDLYGDERDQVYGGVDVESPATSAAVDATRGQVVLYDGKIADTLYCSTSGGRTASAAEATGTPVPYLVPVDDPYDDLSPYHDWGPVLFDVRTAMKAMKATGPIEDLETVTGASGRVGRMTLVAADGTQTTLTGNQVRSELGLRSTWFQPSYLQLLPQSRTITFGGAASLSGSTRSVDALSLESKAAGTAGWVPAGDVTLGPDGSFATVVRPQASTRYRLVWGDARVGLARIDVAPRVTVTSDPGAIQGAIRPVVSQAPVELQQPAGDGWATVSSTTTGPAGSWSFQAVQPGTYRIRVAPGHGLAVGVSASLVVS